MKKNKDIGEVSITGLIEAIRNLHGCKASWVESVPVTETFEGAMVWQGTVQVFELSGHPTAERCYAWSHVIGEGGIRKFFAVLLQGPIDSPQAAVRAAIVAEFRQKEPKSR